MAQEFQSSLKPTECALRSSSCWISGWSITQMIYINSVVAPKNASLVWGPLHGGHRKDTTLQLSEWAGLNLCPK